MNAIEYVPTITKYLSITNWKDNSSEKLKPNDLISIMNATMRYAPYQHDNALLIAEDKISAIYSLLFTKCVCD